MGTSFPNPVSVCNCHLDSWSSVREGPAASSNIATGHTVTAFVPECESWVHVGLGQHVHEL